AQYNLGLSYAKGERTGGTPDNVSAYMWFNIAAASFAATDPRRSTAVGDRDAVASKMTPEEIAEAQKRAREWRPGERGRTLWSGFGPGHSIHSFNHLIGPRQERIRNTHPDCLGGFQIDGQLEFLRLLDRQVRGLRALQNLVREQGAAPEQVGHA